MACAKKWEVFARPQFPSWYNGYTRFESRQDVFARPQFPSWYNASTPSTLFNRGDGAEA